MGCSNSVPVIEVHLTPLAKPVAAVTTRYCSAGFLTLKVDKGFMQSDVNYQNVDTLGNIFIVKDEFLSSRQTLVDGATSAPIVNYKGKTFSSKPIKFVRAGTDSDGPVLFQIYAKYGSSMADVRVLFQDVVSGESCALGFDGNWKQRDGHFWLTRGQSGIRETVAKVHCPGGCSRSKHHIVVSPNMDAALIVMICEILRVEQKNAIEVGSDAVEGVAERLAILHTLRSFKLQPPKFGFVCEIRLGERAFAVVWTLTLLMHTGLAVFYYHVAYLHQYMKSDSLRYYAEYVSPGIFQFFDTIIVCNFLLAVCHLYAIASALGFSARFRRLVFGRHHVIQNKPAALSSLDWIVSWRAYARVSSAATKLFAASTASYSVLFGRRGLLGIEGPHFAKLFLVRELLEIALQTFQAWKLSIYVSTLWVNRAAVVAIVVNCWSTPLIHFLFRGERHESLKTVGCLVLDVLLDILSSAIIPLVIFLPYANAFDTVYGDFPLINYYMDGWYTNAVAETRQVFALSWLDLVSKTFPGYSIFSSMQSIKASFPPPIPRAAPRSVCPAPTASAISRRSTKELSDSRTSVCAPADRYGDDSREQSDPHIARRKVTVAVLKKSAAELVRPQWRKDGKRAEIVLILWGIFVAIMHLHSLTVTRDDGQPGCLLEKRPWMAVRYNCVVMEINCVVANNMRGHDADIERALESLEPLAVKNLIFSSCTELQMPRILQAFSSLETIKVFNSTINRWGDDAALTGAAHPKMLFVYMLDTNLAAIPDGLLSRDFPPTLTDVEFCGSNLTTLPDDLVDYWPNVDYLVLENSPGVRVVPEALRRMRIRHLSLCSNAITALPDYLFFPNQSVQMMELAGNPLSSLPERDESTAGEPTLLNSVTLGYTDIAAFPRWLSELAAEPLSYPLMTISAGETPFCREVVDPEAGRLNAFVFIDCTVNDELPIKLLYPAEMERVWRKQSLLAQISER